MDKTVNEVVKALTPFAHKLGEGAEALYRIYVKQQFVNGVTDIVWAVLCIAATPFLYKLGRKLWVLGKKEEEKPGYSDGFPYFATGVTSWVVSIALVIAFAVALTSGIQHLINPQYYAIKDITCQVTGKGCTDK